MGVHESRRSKREPRKRLEALLRLPLASWYRSTDGRPWFVRSRIHYGSVPCPWRRRGDTGVRGKFSTKKHGGEERVETMGRPFPISTLRPNSVLCCFPRHFYFLSFLARGGGGLLGQTACTDAGNLSVCRTYAVLLPSQYGYLFRCRSLWPGLPLENLGLIMPLDRTIFRVY